ncbi:hypothetical protein BJ742DRAFT_745525 [Cladochytrium replicatum]|nr:hypothetical protein BJ742DRAFT_745525 [Cladochytrium replicatum]
MRGIVPASWARTVTAHITQQELTEPSVDTDQQQQHRLQPQDKLGIPCWRIVWRTSELAQVIIWKQRCEKVVTWEQEKGITPLVKQTQPMKEQQKNGLEQIQHRTKQYQSKEWFDAKMVWFAGLYRNQEAEAGGWEERAPKNTNSRPHWGTIKQKDVLEEVGEDDEDKEGNDQDENENENNK